MAKILVVDDSAPIRIAMKSALKQATGSAQEIVEAANAEEALKVFKRDRPVLVFLDMMLQKGAGGLDALTEMLEVDPLVRVILLTGLPRDHPDVQAAVAMGAFAHVQKPIRADEVRRILMEIDKESGRLGRIPKGPGSGR